MALTDEDKAEIRELFAAAVEAGRRAALGSARHDQGVPSAGTEKEESCRDRQTRIACSDPRGYRAASVGASVPSTRRKRMDLDQLANRTIDILITKRKQTSSQRK